MSGRLKITLDPDAESTEWCDVDAELTLMLDRDQAVKLIARLANYVVESKDGDVDSLALIIEGSAYMTGRLPDRATFNEKGDQVPGIVIVDDVNGWNFPGNAG